MICKWGNKNESLTIIATDSYDKLFLAIIEKQVCDRGVYVNALEKRVKDAQKKMHSKCLVIIDLKARLYSKTFMGWIKRVLSI